jgi:tetratricopeptide (TPR) repeat protein
MRRRGVTAGCGTILLALAGCALVNPRHDRNIPSSSQAALCQQLSQSAQAAIDRQDYDLALVDLERLVAESPRSAEAHHRIGKILQIQGRFDQAKQAYRRALELDREYVGALIGLGEIEDHLGQPEAALGRFESAIEIDPHQAEAHFARGRVLEAIGRTDDALAAYFRTLELNPTSAPAILRVATIQLNRNDPDQALTRLDQVLELTPADPDAHHRRGLAHLALKHPRQAVADLQFAARHLADRPEVFYHLALALQADHQSQGALAAAERAVALAPGYADARNLTQKLRR